MENKFEKCCYSYDVIHSTTQCDPLNCEVNHNPAFDILFHEVNNEYCHCLYRQQLGQYWRCVVENHNLLCPRKCDKCNVCKEVSLIFTNLQESDFFIQILRWLVPINLIKQLKGPFLQFTNKKEFRIEIVQSIPHIGLVLNNGQTC